MKTIPSEVKIASTILIIMGILLFLGLVPLTLLSGSLNSSWLIMISPSLIILCFLFVAGIGLRHAKRWAWWSAQIILLSYPLPF